MKGITKTRAVGGSLIVTIPKDIVEKVSLQEGDLVEINISKFKIDGFGILKEIGSFTEEDELDTEL